MKTLKRIRWLRPSSLSCIWLSQFFYVIFKRGDSIAQLFYSVSKWWNIFVYQIKIWNFRRSASKRLFAFFKLTWSAVLSDFEFMTFDHMTLLRIVVYNLKPIGHLSFLLKLKNISIHGLSDPTTLPPTLIRIISSIISSSSSAFFLWAYFLAATSFLCSWILSCRYWLLVINMLSWGLGM